MSVALVRRATYTLCLTAATALCGCALTFDARTLGANVTLASAPAGAECPTPFHRSQKAIFVLFGMIRASQPSLENVLAGQVTGTQSVTNLRIRVRSRFTDILITGLTAGLVIPRSVSFDGCVVTH